MPADNANTPSSSVLRSPTRLYRKALLSPSPGAALEPRAAVNLTLPPAAISDAVPAGAPAANASDGDSAAPTVPASRKRAVANAASASNTTPPVKRAGPNRLANAQAIADAKEYPELRETPIMLKIPGFRPSMFKELTQELLGALQLNRNLSAAAPSNPLACFHLDGDNITFVLKNREATARLLNTSFVFRGHTFPWMTEKGTVRPSQKE
ncbi:hypothetical protein COEREDRAFT_12336 [Coemansia reversa NRRL 1564]|uniref:Uncharacterized protein n=1 Tax=Coemansia reversa (strain ATCC 12441 / NRRL 1564) TaxID=763665 RepID=A0A2G5B114_COERN|nr:hypothetical protein COEREDRAFT_12336 [Coemansia reversa NRRL 1564]|eukprot:PIA12700.1 hypothetical protein COEREDRAFT_12336 [Coemansia reversa NRRL 1564]